MGKNGESSELVASADPLIDPELVALPRPPRQERTISLLLMGLTGLLAVFMTAALASDVTYAFAGSAPEPVGELSHLAPASPLRNTFVRADGLLRRESAIRYHRPLETDTFQLVPVAGNDRIWVELRVPPGPPNAVAVPPTTFVGRLLPMRSIAFGFGGLRRSVETSAAPIAPDAWVLIDGATPTSSQWTVALAALLALFAGYNLLMIARILRPAR
ncbi:MAG TPA: hypothetical protein VK550_25355 [Polyangiaceae bacterium]|jgi:hypothetical protein|nr:hypothetical protein [Polyangiaceae bacterium]